MLTVLTLRPGEGGWSESVAAMWFHRSNGKLRSFRLNESVQKPSESVLDKVKGTVLRVAPWLSLVAVGPEMVDRPITSGLYLRDTKAILLACHTDLLYTLPHELYHAVDCVKLPGTARALVAEWLEEPYPPRNDDQLREASAHAFQAWATGSLEDRPPPEIEQLFGAVWRGDYA